MEVYFISDSRLGGGHILSQTKRMIQSGVDILQVREKVLPDRELLDSCRKVRKTAEGYKLKLLVNGRFDMALLSDFNGIQLPENGIPVSSIRKKTYKKLLIFKSCHSYESAKKAEDDGADAIIFGPIFYTPSKKQYGSPIGTNVLYKTAKAITIPIYAIGGINIKNAGSLRDAGVTGVAMIRALVFSKNPKTLIKALHDL